MPSDLWCSPRLNQCLAYVERLMPRRCGTVSKPVRDLLSFKDLRPRLSVLSLDRACRFPGWKVTTSTPPRVLKRGLVITAGFEMMRQPFLASKTESNDMTNTVSIAGTTLELVDRGLGRPLLFLHAGEGLAPERPWLELLSRRYREIAPWHPGYGHSPLIDGGGSVDDLAYLYLDLAAELKLENAVLVGACFGGWIAAEMMVRSTARFSHLVLVDPLGIKFSGREQRDIADMHALPRAEYLKFAWANPAKGDVDFTKLPESELAAIVRGREAFALYGWKPYMHNPRLKRWLHRIDLPTLLLWGAEDRIVTPAYGEGWRHAIPGAGSKSFHRPATSLTGSSPRHSSNAFRPLSTKAARRRDPHSSVTLL